MILPIKRDNKESFGAVLDFVKESPEYLTEILTKHPKDVTPMKEAKKLKGKGVFARCVPISA
jgi:hypothetical protein